MRGREDSSFGLSLKPLAYSPPVFQHLEGHRFMNRKLPGLNPASKATIAGENR